MILICVEIIQKVFSASMEAENIYQKSDYPQFWNSTRNTSVETYRLQKSVDRHMCNLTLTKGWTIYLGGGIFRGFIPVKVRLPEKLADEVYHRETGSTR